MAWDGTFEKSSYRKTGNLVNDVIENGGRVLHEPTVDGGTHEIIDRGTHISEDYYFPQRTPGKKPHIHYELRSTGEILIDGKDIRNQRGAGQMSYRVKSRGLKRYPDGTSIRPPIEPPVEDGENLQEEGEKFVRDKEQLEQALDTVENARISDADKQALKEELYRAIESLQDQYETDVEDKETELEEAFEEAIDEMQDAADELGRQAEDLSSIKMEVSKTDASDAAEVARKEQAEFEAMMADANQKLDLQIQQMNMIRQNVRRRSLGSR